MNKNQTALEIARGYAKMATQAANQNFRLAQKHPFHAFPALKKHEDFCTSMARIWERIAYNIDKGPEMYEQEWGGFYD